jgi:predicted dehydrogenase
MKKKRFAIFGTGFWSRFQLEGWREVDKAECVALYNRTRSKAETLARDFGIPSVYDNPEDLLENESIDFMDIIVGPDVHSEFVQLAVANQLPVICQKPMAPTLEIADAMVDSCRQANIPFLVHENWRWQPPIRAFKSELDKGEIGHPFAARIDYLSSLRVWEQQPFLKDLDQFIIMDMGSHILDVARFLFGDAVSVYCQTHHVSDELRGEDVAVVMMKMATGVTVICEISYASVTERERPSETYVFVEGERGSIELGPDYWIRTTTREGTRSSQHVPPVYGWGDTSKKAVMASIVPCTQNMFKGISGEGEAETTGEDNLKTMRLVFGAYESAAKNRVIEL